MATNVKKNVPMVVLATVLRKEDFVLHVNLATMEMIVDIYAPSAAMEDVIKVMATAMTVKLVTMVMNVTSGVMHIVKSVTGIIHIAKNAY